MKNLAKYVLVASISGLAWYLVGWELAEIKFKAESSSMLCQYSKWNTGDFQVINGHIYCRSSPDAYQALKKHKEKSKRLEEHKIE